MGRAFLEDEEEQKHWGAPHWDDFPEENVRSPLDDFADELKREFYYEFEEIMPSIMSDKIDGLVKKYKEIL